MSNTNTQQQRQTLSDEQYQLLMGEDTKLTLHITELPCEAYRLDDETIVYANEDRILALENNRGNFTCLTTVNLIGGYKVTDETTLRLMMLCTNIKHITGVN